MRVLAAFSSASASVGGVAARRWRWPQRCSSSSSGVTGALDHLWQHLALQSEIERVPAGGQGQALDLGLQGQVLPEMVQRAGGIALGLQQLGQLQMGLAGLGARLDALGQRQAVAGGAHGRRVVAAGQRDLGPGAAGRGLQPGVAVAGSDVQRQAAVGHGPVHALAGQGRAREMPVRLGLEDAVGAAPRRGQAMAEVTLRRGQVAGLEAAHADVQRQLGRQIAVVAVLAGLGQLLAGIPHLAQAARPAALRIVDLAQADARRHAGLQMAADLGEVQRAGPLLAGELVLALLVGNAPQCLADARRLHREVARRGLGAGLLQRRQQLQRAAARFQQAEAGIQRIHADSDVACGESVYAEGVQQPVGHAGMAVGDAGDSAQQVGQGLAGGRLEGEHGSFR
jgi:hypothetical protein